MLQQQIKVLIQTVGVEIHINQILNQGAQALLIKEILLINWNNLIN